MADYENRLNDGLILGMKNFIVRRRRMKDSINKLLDIGSFDLKRTMKFLFWIGTIVIVYTSLKFSYLLGPNIYTHSPILKSVGHEAFVSYVKRIDYISVASNILSLIIGIVIRVAILRIGTEFLYIVLNGFKSLSKLDK